MIEFDERRPWDRSAILLLIGPGGAGKSSLSRALAPLLGYDLIDLDEEFSRRIGGIDAVIRDEGYASYKSRNSRLAAALAADAVDRMILVTSSGFLTRDNPEPALAANRGLLADCYSICLLPSRDLEQAVATIVARQLTRPFARDRSREEATIRHRYPTYATSGDLILFSAEPPAAIASAVAHRLSAAR
ncbi:shikimate kinase [Sphingomonas sp. BIUV-7]|uniref:Shikimate kinase n=1 Tax=Sphingomonas natans TaxID=3063330 RepID=A0ABT8Y7W4_9SPHN|nr:shikimate kinase [Sphingomonas sp. BIUV-7]MDO6413790.1 shikimate kinase [Sphingomonas sp. BIUV-7]